MSAGNIYFANGTFQFPQPGWTQTVNIQKDLFDKIKALEEKNVALETRLGSVTADQIRQLSKLVNDKKIWFVDDTLHLNFQEARLHNVCGHSDIRWHGGCNLVNALG